VLMFGPSACIGATARWGAIDKQTGNANEGDRVRLRESRRIRNCVRNDLSGNANILGCVEGNGCHSGAWKLVCAPAVSIIIIKTMILGLVRSRDKTASAPPHHTHRYSDSTSEKYSLVQPER